MRSLEEEFNKLSYFLIGDDKSKVLVVSVFLEIGLMSGLINGLPVS